MSESQTKAGNQECFAKLAKLANLQNLQIDPLDMLNNFCFHVYTQKSLFINLQNLQSCKLAKLANLQNLKIDPWDMLNNFCFHVYAQKSLFIGENVNDFFLTATATTSPSPVTFEFIELVPS